MTAFEYQNPLSVLRKALDESGLSYEEKSSELSFSLDAPKATEKIVNISFFASKDGQFVRAQAIAPGATLKREKISEAYQYANLWNSHRSFSRVVVHNVDEPDRDLSFVADATFYTNAPYDPRRLRAFFFGRFVPSAVEFFETIGKILKQANLKKGNKR